LESNETFAIKYFTTDDAHHLLDALQTEYVASIDWTGSHFCRLQISWNYPACYVNISMPNYIPTLLKKFAYSPKIPQYSPYPVAPFTTPQKGQRQYAPAPDTTPQLDKTNTTTMQSIIGSLLYNARGVDSTLLPALNTLATTQASPTETTLKHCYRLLNYVATFFVCHHSILRLGHATPY